MTDERLAEIEGCKALAHRCQCHESVPELVAEVRRLREELQENEAAFDLQWKASRRAIKLWQASHPGNDHVWPDHADLCVWLMEQLMGDSCKTKTTSDSMATTTGPGGTTAG
jgi:hypothetical protein